MGEIRAPKGERTRVLYIWSSSIPGAIRFRARTASGKPPSGKVETAIRRLFKFRTAEYPLAAENSLAKGMMDASYQVFVTPNEDTVVEFESRHLQARTLIWALVALVILGAIAGFLPLILNSLNG